MGAHARAANRQAQESMRWIVLLGDGRAIERFEYPAIGQTPEGDPGSLLQLAPQCWAVLGERGAGLAGRRRSDSPFTWESEGPARAVASLIPGARAIEVESVEAARP